MNVYSRLAGDGIQEVGRRVEKKDRKLSMWLVSWGSRTIWEEGGKGLHLLFVGDSIGGQSRIYRGIGRYRNLTWLRSL